RPALFRTTGTFLRTFGISSLDELPPLPETEPEDEDGQMKLIQAIAALQPPKEAAESTEEGESP
ncbi:MAG: SMC-Scp complex subunit ScpB, partial [Oscillospiraceae bacterium]|nr:SMC-Scp complex subunit ScpB [Oscillospiraceae bacterium]